MTYTWRCAKCEIEVDVSRTFADYKSPPSEDEAPAGCGHVWRKVFYATPMTRGLGYKGKKGSW